MKSIFLFLAIALTSCCKKDLKRCYQCVHNTYQGNNVKGYVLQPNSTTENICEKTTSEMLDYVANNSHDTVQINESEFRFEELRCTEQK